MIYYKKMREKKNKIKYKNENEIEKLNTQPDSGANKKSKKIIIF